MPIYEFHCEKCGKDSEILVRSTQWQGALCPHCGSTRLSKKLSVFASSSASSSSSGSGGGDGGGCGGGGCACACRGAHHH